MLKGAEDTERVAEFYEYIQVAEVRDAFALLVGTFICAKSIDCRTARQGKVRSIAVDQGGAWCFSIMPSRKRLLFHWRPPVIDLYRAQKDVIKARFVDNFTDNAHKHSEHWSVNIRSIEDALLLLGTLRLN